MICDSCGTNNSDDRIYCIACMNKLKNKCAKCETIFDLSVNRCPKCQSKVIKGIKVNTDSKGVNIMLFAYPFIAMIFSVIMLALLNNIGYKTLELVDGVTYINPHGLIDSISFMLILNISSILVIGLSIVYIMILLKKGKINILRRMKDVILILAIVGITSLIIYSKNIKNGNIYKYSTFDKSMIYDIKGITPLVTLYIVMLILMIVFEVVEISVEKGIFNK